MVLHQAGENTVRYSIRSCKAQLSPVMRLVCCVGPFGRIVAAAYRVAPRPAQPGAWQGLILLGNRRILRNGQAWLVWCLSWRSLGTAASIRYAFVLAKGRHSITGPSLNEHG